MALPQSRPDRSTRWLVLILAIYALLAGLYAVYTPAWQAPDEPAHYNYVRHLVEERRLPELRPGDYPVEYLEEIKAARFPPEMSVAPIRYESHQPPLYYLLAAPVYALGRALGMQTPLLPLRLFSVVLGIALVAGGYAVVRRAWPARPILAWGTAAFMATLPMHVAMTGVMNNDVLAALVLTQVVWLLLWVGQRGWTAQRSVWIGLLLGLALLTKLQAYIAVPLVGLAWLWDAERLRRRSEPLGPSVQRALIVGGVALLLVLPWLARNVAVYGLGDPLAMARHDQVVVGQLTTRELVGEIGIGALMQRLVQTTFQSFWGQFGWMGVLLPLRVYQALAALSALALLGIVDALPALRTAWRDESQRYSLILLGAWGGFTAAGFIWYNLQYVQHQGRYLFPALVPLGLLFAVGIQRLLQHRPLWVMGLLALTATALLLWGFITGEFRQFTLVLLGGAMTGIALGHELERRAVLPLAGLPLACLYAGLGGLTLWALQHMVPLLRP